jgi:hypothetical protein
MCFESLDKKVGSPTQLPRHLVGANVKRWRKDEKEKRRCLDGIITEQKRKE